MDGGNEVNRINSAGRQQLLSLLAAGQILSGFEDEFIKIMSRIGNGVERFGNICRELDALNNELLRTVPKDQLQSMLKQSKFTRIAVLSKTDTRQLDGDWVTNRDDLAYLFDLAITGNCIACDDESGHKCRLRRLLSEYPVVKSDVTNVVCPCMHGTGKEFDDP